ncbi:MAG: YcgN family cysteine cluster protein [Pelolinea sp.]|nr:YcgN family cysteine cluster protein [Pelolinea sp.]
MTIRKGFWKSKKLTDLSPEEWEALCDGCGICCLYKVEYEDTGEVELTNIVCRFLDLDCIRCQLYGDRISAMPTCIKLTPSKVESLKWLPETCAYLLIFRGQPLPDWHPLESGNLQSIHDAGISVKGKVIREIDADMDRLEDYIISSDEE